MYDYVLQYGFDTDSQNVIQKIKDYLKNNGIKDREREWLPHITIDIYDCKNQEEFIEKLDLVIQKVKPFDVEFKNLNNCNGETLYIEPYEDKKLMELKVFFDKELNEYMLEHRRTRKYIPHATLCTSDYLEKSIKLANEKFLPFVAKVECIWVYNNEMNLIKEYRLRNENRED